MRKILMTLCLMFVTLAQAQDLKTLKFGTIFDDAIINLKSSLGEPTTSNTNLVVYQNVHYRGFKWDKITFKFAQRKLCEVRCYMNKKNKQQALTQLSAIAKTMKKDYSITMDYEDDGDVFYSGGVSPMGFGHLFTIFVSPYNSIWTAQMRFGPFSI
ncbi:hypothetical protein HMPREF1640_06960 [Prevotella sp. S7-1-8]|uniref:hypothetical protein n=1 Tax=Prevotella sp. S7-1-8 TaxID=1284775 RepID=UPI0005104728|nr:hypothetical protein [Prevotella sp. S7-1-8]KGF17504.1 hypothetical protein HMPREF1640_06960 [Prevotella sp. S7-1-8]